MIDLPYPSEDDRKRFHEFYDHHPDEIETDHEVHLPPEAFEKLYEYSGSEPTGVYIGKRWRSRSQSGDWFIADYMEHGGQVRTRYRWALDMNGEIYRGKKKMRGIA